MKTGRMHRLLGIEQFRVSHAERGISVLGGFLGILAVFLVSSLFTGGAGLGWLQLG